jgi:hypothetical protein
MIDSFLLFIIWLAQPRYMLLRRRRFRSSFDRPDLHDYGGHDGVKIVLIEAVSFLNHSPSTGLLDRASADVIADWSAPSWFLDIPMFALLW